MRRLRRLPLLLALFWMPDEAFGWFVMWAARSSARMPMAYQFPDGIGGFRDVSRRAITRLRAAADAYIAWVTEEEDPAA